MLATKSETYLLAFNFSFVTVSAVTILVIDVACLNDLPEVLSLAP